MQSINPTTAQPIRDYPDHTPADVNRLLHRAEAAFAQWRLTSFPDRSRLLRSAAARLREQKSDLSRLMTLEMGKPIPGAESEIEKCALACDYFAGHAESFLRPEMIPTDATRSYVRYDPLGPVLAIMPWNFPFWQVFRFAAPALMAGNVAVLKHAPNVPGCALAIENLFTKSGFPQGVFTSLLVPNDRAHALIEHPAIKAVTLTGSERAGRAVASESGSALKKTVLELGGSDPFIVLADADVPSVAKQAAKARCINSGQSCIAAKRFIVETPIADAFEAAFAREMAGLKVGDPLDRSTDIGPLARADLLDNLDGQVQRSLAAGARLLTGGRRLARGGFFYEPTVLTNVRPGNPAWDEESFGPVAAVTRATDADHAVQLANATKYGLGASIWTSNPANAEPLIPRIDAGCVFVNAPVASDPRLPFGGIKNSGYGRELSSHGIREFTNVKTVWVK